MNEPIQNVNQNPENQNLLIFRQAIRNKGIENESDRTPIYLVQNNGCLESLIRLNDFRPIKRLFTFDNIAADLVKDQKEPSSLFPVGLDHENAFLSPVIVYYDDCKDKRITQVREILKGANIPVFLQDKTKTISIIKDTSIEAVKNEINRQYSEMCSGKSSRQEFEKGFEQNQSNRAISTGYPILDKCLDGGFYAGLYCIGGGTGTGKTTFTLNIADNIARSGKSVIMIALEMSRNELFAKMISKISLDQCKQAEIKNDYAQTTRDILKGGKPNETKEDRYIRESSIENYFDQVAKNLYIHESIGDFTVEELKTIIQNHIDHTGSSPVVIIDYLQIMSHSNDYIKSNDKIKTDRNVLALKQLSRDFNIPIIMVSSLNRESYKDLTQEVSLTSFKESGAIEYSCDVVLGLQLSIVTDLAIAKRNKDKENQKIHELQFDNEIRSIPRRMDVRVLKNRHGANNGTVRYQYYPNLNHFKETISVKYSKTPEQIEKELKRSLTSFDN